MTFPEHAAPAYPAQDWAQPRSGIVYLRNSVADYFTANAVPAVVTPVGLKYRDFKLNQSFPSNANRVVFIPGEFDGTSPPKARRGGSLSRNNFNAGSVINPRELLSWERAITISIWSAPANGKFEDEQEAVATCDDLLAWVVRGVQSAGTATILWGDVTIQSQNKESVFGVELLVSAVQITPIFDKTLEIKFAVPSVSRGT